MSERVMDMPKRPVSVIAIGWLVLVGGIIALASAFLVFAVPELQHAVEESRWSLVEAVSWSAVWGLTYIAAGLGMLKALNWGRLLFLIYTPLALLLSWVLRGFEWLSLTLLPLYVVALVFLARPAAATFFATRRLPRPS
jgi:uncharacterized membrane protein HdeD (DUF308 family)